MNRFRTLPFSGGISSGLRGLAVGLIALCAAMAWTAPAAQATVVPGHASFDHTGDILTDLTEGLQWLDLTLTAGMSYDAVDAQRGAGGLFEGWDFATGDQFNQLIENWTGRADMTSVTTTYFHSEGAGSTIDDLIPLLGDTYDAFIVGCCNAGGSDAHNGDGSASSGTHYSRGFLADIYPSNTNYRYIASVYDQRDLPGDTASDFSLAYTTAGDKSTNPDAARASFLVRSTIEVPEPASLALFSLGLAGLGFVRRRRQKVAA